MSCCAVDGRASGRKETRAELTMSCAIHTHAHSPGQLVEHLQLPNGYSLYSMKFV